MGKEQEGEVGGGGGGGLLMVGWPSGILLGPKEISVFRSVN